MFVLLVPRVLFFVLLLPSRARRFFFFFFFSRVQFFREAGGGAAGVGSFSLEAMGAREHVCVRASMNSRIAVRRQGVDVGEVGERRVKTPKRIDERVRDKNQQQSVSRGTSEHHACVVLWFTVCSVLVQWSSKVVRWPVLRWLLTSFSQYGRRTSSTSTGRSAGNGSGNDISSSLSARRERWGESVIHVVSTRGGRLFIFLPPAIHQATHDFCKEKKTKKTTHAHAHALTRTYRRKEAEWPPRNAPGGSGFPPSPARSRLQPPPCWRSLHPCQSPCDQTETPAQRTVVCRSG